MQHGATLLTRPNQVKLAAVLKIFVDFNFPEPNYVALVCGRGASPDKTTHINLESVMRLLTVAAILAVFVAAPAIAEDLQFTLINTSSHDIVEMYLTPHEKDTWGPNILSVPSIPAGTQGTIAIADGETVCDYDIRFVTGDGITVDATQDMCKLATFTFHD